MILRVPTFDWTLISLPTNGFKAKISQGINRLQQGADHSSQSSVKAKMMTFYLHSPTRLHTVAFKWRNNFVFTVLGYHSSGVYLYREVFGSYLNTITRFRYFHQFLPANKGIVHWKKLRLPLSVLLSLYYSLQYPYFIQCWTAAFLCFTQHVFDKYQHA